MHYVISDIHGHFKKFQVMLNKIEFSPDDTLYVIGDAIDRGPDSFRVLEFIANHDNIIHIKGNHELFLQLYIEGNFMMRKNYARFGGEPVVLELSKISHDDLDRLHKYLAKLPKYVELNVGGVDYVLTHSGYYSDAVPVYCEDGATIDTVKSIEKWTKIAEYSYLTYADLQDSPASVKFDKMLIVGHMPTVRIDDTAGIYKCRRYIDIDNGVGVIPGAKLACLRLEDMQEFYV